MVYVNMIFKFFFPLFIMHSAVDNLFLKIFLFLFSLIYFVYISPKDATNVLQNEFTSSNYTSATVLSSSMQDYNNRLNAAAASKAQPEYFSSLII